MSDTQPPPAEDTPAPGKKPRAKKAPNPRIVELEKELKDVQGYLVEAERENAQFKQQKEQAFKACDDWKKIYGQLQAEKLNLEKLLREPPKERSVREKEVSPARASGVAIATLIVASATLLGIITLLLLQK